MSKADRKAELERQYKEELEKIESEAEEDGDSGDEIIILRGNASKDFIKHLKKLGYSEEEAQEEAEEIEEEVEQENSGEEAAEELGEENEDSAPSKSKSKSSAKTTTPKNDPKPPSSHRYFGGSR